MEKRQKKRLLLDYLSDNLKHHNWWAYRYFFCEFLALINVIGEWRQTIVGHHITFLSLGQMFLMDRFFDGAFLTFGLEVIAFAEQDQEDRLDPLIYVFPRMTKVRLAVHVSLQQL